MPSIPMENTSRTSRTSIAKSNDSNSDVNNSSTAEKAAKEAAKEAAAEWEKRTTSWASMVPSDGIELPKDFDLKDPKWKDRVKVEMGPPMTAEQFKAWHERRRHQMRQS